jgi:Mrp family chromosome partitioning ATPase
VNASAATETLGKRLVVVTGKGGVGKSTTAGALAPAAATRGLRTIVIEVAGRALCRACLAPGRARPKPS